MSNELDFTLGHVLNALQGDAMATTALRSYNKKISHGGAIIAPQSNISTHTIFQVPAGKTWLVIKIWGRIVSWNGEETASLTVQKSASDGTVQITLLAGISTETIKLNPEGKIVDHPFSSDVIQNVVLKDQEMLRQVLDMSPKGSLVTQYEISVLETTP